ncbi:hypothetical protein ACFL08_03855 [Patescibacteria group bacterium]
MNIKNILNAIFIAFGFVLWPIAGISTGVSGGLLSTLVMIPTAITVAALTFRRPTDISNLSINVVLILIGLGILNGVAAYIYADKLATKAVPIAIFIVTVSVLMVVMTPILDWLINRTIPNFDRIMGFTFAAAAIYFLSK